MAAEKFEFEGEQLTVKQIRERVPILGEESIRNHLRAGRNTRTAMLSHVPKRPKPSKRAAAFRVGFKHVNRDR